MCRSVQKVAHRLSEVMAVGLTLALFLVGCGPLPVPTSTLTPVPATATPEPTDTLTPAPPIEPAALEEPSVTVTAELTEAMTATVETTRVAEGETGLEKVVLILDWVPNTNHTGLYVALDKGWYEEEGVDLEIQSPSDPAAALKQVAIGHTEFGVSFQEEVTIARSQGIPIVSIAAVIQHNTSAFVSLPESGIKSPKDFEGKKYAAFGVPLEKPVLQGLMECDDADVEKVEFVDVGFDSLPALLGGKVDFAWIFLGWEGIQAEMMGVKLNSIPLAESCIPDYYTPILISGEKTLEERPEVVRRFMAATKRGYEFTIENPKEAAEILIKYTPETDPELIRRSQEWLSPRYRDDAARWGIQDGKVWQEFGEWMAERGLLPGPFDPEEAFTTEFLSQ